MQSAVGEWHDWQGLAQLAGRTFRCRNTADGLAKLLEARAQESLRVALSLCRRTTAQLLKRNSGSAPSSQQ
jgi:hypothetical protein